MPSFARFIPRWIRRRFRRSPARPPVPTYDDAMSRPPPPSYGELDPFYRMRPPKYSRHDEAGLSVNPFYRNELRHIEEIVEGLRARANRNSAPAPAGYDPAVGGYRPVQDALIPGVPPRYREKRLVAEDLEEELDTLHKRMDAHLYRELRRPMPTGEVINSLSGNPIVREFELHREWRIRRQMDVLNFYAERLNTLAPRMNSLFDNEITDPQIQQSLKLRYALTCHQYDRYRRFHDWLIADRG